MDEFCKNKQIDLMYEFNLRSCKDNKIIDREQNLLKFTNEYTTMAWDMKYGYLVKIQCVTTLDKVSDFYFVIKDNKSRPINSTTGKVIEDGFFNSYLFELDEVTPEWLLEYSLYQFKENGYVLGNSYGEHENINFEID